MQEGNEGKPGRGWTWYIGTLLHQTLHLNIPALRGSLNGGRSLYRTLNHANAQRPWALNAALCPSWLPPVFNLGIEDTSTFRSATPDIMPESHLDPIFPALPQWDLSWTCAMAFQLVFLCAVLLSFQKAILLTSTRVISQNTRQFHRARLRTRWCPSHGR